MRAKRYWVSGVPCTASARGRCAREWRNALRKVMRQMPPEYRPCSLGAAFMLPDRKFTVRVPDGPNVDNLGKLLMNVLGETVLRGAPGRDAVIVGVSLVKLPADSKKGPGVYFELKPVGR